MSKHHYGGCAGKQGTLDMQRKIAHLGRVIHDKQRDAEKRNEQIRQLKEENEKLRELSTHMLRCIRRKNNMMSYCWECPHHKPVDELRHYCFVTEDARELGVEAC